MITINDYNKTDRISDSGIYQVISDAQYPGRELHIRNKTGKITSNAVENGRRNFSSSTKIEKELE